MAREIKLQAWSKDHKFMGNVYSLDFETGLVKVEHCQKGTAHTLGISNVSLRQFTGLKDQNDKEIFEGDLVWETHTVPEERFVTVCPIEFVDGMFIINDENFGEQTPLHENVYGCEVVGNIYETPELADVLDE